MWEGRETSPYMRTPGWRNWGFLFVFVSYLKTDIFGDVCFLHVSGGFEKKKKEYFRCSILPNSDAIEMLHGILK